jgi:citrate lyase subunit beta/citryl-CoA lyase
LFDKSYDILDAYREATEHQHTGALMFGDEMIDEASAKIANSFVARGERSGMKRSEK